jgi:hypothetical protein
MRRRGTATLVVAAVACGGQTTAPSGPGSATVDGTVEGQVVPTNAAVGLYSLESEYGGTRVLTGALVTNVTDACTVLQHHGNPAGASSLIAAVVATGNTLPTGTYTISATANPSASVFYGVENDACTETTSEQASSGTVTLSAISQTLIAGSFDATFANGDHVTGTFSAPVCDFSVAADGGTGPCSQ